MDFIHVAFVVMDDLGLLGAVGWPVRAPVTVTSRSPFHCYNSSSPPRFIKITKRDSIKKGGQEEDMFRPKVAEIKGPNILSLEVQFWWVFFVPFELGQRRFLFLL